MKRQPRATDGSVLVAAALSATGLIAHNLVEFSARVLLGPETLMPLAATAALVGLWLRRPRPSVLLLLSAWAGLHLLLGVASALPLPVLPFQPEQTISHYTAHVAYAAAQAPLLWLGIRRRRPASGGVTPLRSSQSA